MERSDALKDCRFYKGEEACPFNEAGDIRRRYWSWEQKYVKCATEGEALLDEYALELRLDWEFRLDYLDINFFLMSVMYNDFLHWGGDKDSFEDALLSYLNAP